MKLFIKQKKLPILNEGSMYQSARQGAKVRSQRKVISTDHKIIFRGQRYNFFMWKICMHSRNDMFIIIYYKVK